MIGSPSGRRASSDVSSLILTVSEVLFVATVVVATLVGWVGGAPVGAFLGWVAIYGLALALVAPVVAWLLRLNARIARGLADVSLTFVVYGALTPLIAPLGWRAIDGTLRWPEEAFFGTTLVQMVEPYTSPALTSFFSLVYSIHVPLFLIPASLHWWAGRRLQAERLLLTLALSMYVGFLGYALFPAYGPVGTLTALRPLGGNVATYLIAAYAVALGTFPSLHAGISAAVAIDGWRTSRRWGVVFTTVAVLIWASTIYLRYHWLADLLAGLALAAFATWLSGRLQVVWPRVALRWPLGLARRPAEAVFPAEAGAGD